MRTKSPAYVVDQQAKGSWTQIGYSAPTSNNFNYGTTGHDWAAEGQFDVSACTGTGAGTWSIDVTVPSTAGASASYTVSDNCPALTPNFHNIGQGSTATAAPANP